MLLTQALTFSYNLNTAFVFPDIFLSQGDDLLVLGPSGVGKTTLLHLLAGLLKPQSGQVIIDDTILNELSDSQLDQFRGSNIGLVFQQPHLIRSISLFENFALMQALGSHQKDLKRIIHLLESLNLLHRKNSRPYALSQGERQRAAIALALLNNPQLILADEPTSSLDDNNCQDVITLLKEQSRATNAQMVIITHDHRLKPFFDKTIVL
ncbi:MAG: ATP-binding cassette domain-containing protein [Fulvivirga sp.]|uniref:ABC transporter ATP-binding protein n=1 Tax=Fulvivirga sp. TaxID=1931237 RepID=UPI0032F36BAC